MAVICWMVAGFVWIVDIAMLPYELESKSLKRQGKKDENNSKMVTVCIFMTQL